MTATIHPLPLPKAEPLSPRKETLADLGEIFLTGMSEDELRAKGPLFCEMADAVEEIRLRLTASGVGAILGLAP